MKLKRILFLFFLVVTMVINCNDSNEVNPKSNIQIGKEGGNQVNPIITIVEIPMTNVKKAITFYEKIFSIQIEEMEMGDSVLGVFPTVSNGPSIVLTKGKDYQPKSEGVLVYLNAGEDLTPVLNLVEPSGGKILLKKTEISPEMGYYALFLDIEGNRIGLHSSK
ncbi:VOC family protein [Leptospira sp. WS39.C2]